MPELPEVETIRLQLEKYLKGHKIENVQINAPKIFSGEENKVLGTGILGIRRFAKVLVIDLSNGFSIVIHIKLTGQLIYRGPNLPHSVQSSAGLSKKVVGGVPGKHTHVIFKLDRGGMLYYNDVRKFGWIRLVESKQVTSDKFIGKLGPEPQVAQGSAGRSPLTLETFRRILSKSSRPIKILLLDQSKISGVGNIYANDALWLAKISPRIPAKQLNNEAIEQLYEAIHKVLKAGLKYGGASELAFVTPDGSEGKYQDHTLVYGREGEPCERCHKAEIQKFFLSGRGTYFCPNCQKN